jgi:hypothetical protein
MSRLRAGIAPLVLSTLVLGMAAAGSPASAIAGTCANEEVRAEQGSQWLPDCRAFELVTPEVKGDNSTIGASEGNGYAFPDGNHFSYLSMMALPGAESGGPESMLSERTPVGWKNVALAPPEGSGEPIGLTTEILGAANAYYFTAFTGDFSAAFVNSPFDTDAEDQDKTLDAYKRDLSTGAWTLVSRPDAGPMTEAYQPEYGLSGAYVAGVSQDGNHALFETIAEPPVAPGTPSGPHSADMLYDRTGGHTYAVGVLPDGTISPSCDVELGNGVADNRSQMALSYGAISADGSNVVFTTKATGSDECSSSAVYLRKDDSTTVQLPGGTYLGRSSDGTKIFTANGSVDERAKGVNEYDVASGQSTTISPEGWFVAASADGSHVYYLTGELTQELLVSNAKLYLWNSGSTTLIPGVGPGFADDLLVSGGFSAQLDVAVATPDGSKLLFRDRANLTNRDVTSEPCTRHNELYGLGGTTGFLENCPEAYVYDADTGAMTCVSCNPMDVPPAGITHLMGLEQKNDAVPDYSSGQISPDGSRVFFETEDALVPQDTNGLADVYEWENGRVYLISSGQGTFGSAFSGASTDGHDVFLTTTDRLAPQDIESSTAFYDARIDGGFPYRPFVPGCDSGQCQGPQTPAPAFEAPASATFVGLGNPVAPTVKAKPKATKRQKVRHRKRRHRHARRTGHGNGKRKGRK